MNSFQNWAQQCGDELRKDTVRCVQVNVGYRCNLQCVHCHVEAGPDRQECMDWTVMADVLQFIDRAMIAEVDITGGAPEMNPNVIKFITELRKRNFIDRIILRTNLAIYEDEAFRHLPETLFSLGVELIASMPCYLEENIDQQRGKGVFRKNLEVLRRLNQVGFGTGKTGRQLHLVYNPGGAFLPGGQQELEQAYKEHMSTEYGIVFDQLFTIANMPIGRYLLELQAQDALDAYLELLKCSSNIDNLSGVMCRYTISVDWQGYVYDCDFNQALNKPAIARDTYIGQLCPQDLNGMPVVTGDHCFGCTAGAGSSCRGSFVAQPA